MSDTRAAIRKVDNGYIVESFRSGIGNEEFVFSELQEALARIASLYTDHNVGQSIGGAATFHTCESDGENWASRLK